MSINISEQESLAIARQLPDELKLLLIKEWTKELNKKAEEASSIFLTLEGFDTPIELESNQIKHKNLMPLKELWADELPAEELVKML